MCNKVKLKNNNNNNIKLIWEFLNNSGGYQFYQNEDIIIHICSFIFDIRDDRQYPTAYFLFKIQKMLNTKQKDYKLYQIIFSHKGVQKAINEKRLINLLSFYNLYTKKFKSTKQIINNEDKPKNIYTFYSICCSSQNKFKKHEIWYKRYNIPVDSKLQRLNEYNRNGFHKKGYDKDGFDPNGYNKYSYNRKGFDANGFNKEGYDKNGYDEYGYDRYGYDKHGYDRDGEPKYEYDDDYYCRDYLGSSCVMCGRDGRCNCDEWC